MRKSPAIGLIAGVSAMLGTTDVAADLVVAHQDGFWFDNADPAAVLHVRLHRPDGHMEELALPGGGALVMDAAWLGADAPDGLYRYDAIQVGTRPTGTAPRQVLDNGRDPGAELAGVMTEPVIESGSFRLVGGEIVLPPSDVEGGER